MSLKLETGYATVSLLVQWGMGMQNPFHSTGGIAVFSSVHQRAGPSEVLACKSLVAICNFCWLRNPSLNSGRFLSVMYHQCTAFFFGNDWTNHRLPALTNAGFEAALDWKEQNCG